MESPSNTKCFLMNWTCWNDWNISFKLVPHNTPGQYHNILVTWGWTDERKHWLYAATLTLGFRVLGLPWWKVRKNADSAQAPFSEKPSGYIEHIRYQNINKICSSQFHPWPRKEQTQYETRVSGVLKFGFAWKKTKTKLYRFDKRWMFHGGNLEISLSKSGQYHTMWGPQDS